MSGWISLDRAITNHWLWQNEKFTKGQAWIDLLLWAAHTQHKVLLKGTLIPVARGEQIRSQTTLAKTWNWDRKTVSRFLKLLEKDGMISSRVDHLTSYVSICNYDSFQDNSKGDTHPKGQLKGQLKGQQAPSREDTNNKGNKDNNDKNISKVDNFDYETVKEIFNRVMVGSPKVEKFNPKRKRMIKSLFKFAGFDMVKFENYLTHFATEPSWHWVFEHRTGTNGINYKPCRFEYFLKDETYLMAKEEINEQ